MTHRHLCVVALEQFQTGHPEDYSAWAELVKRRCAALGFAYDVTPVSRALAAVQRYYRLAFPMAVRVVSARPPSPAPLSRAEAASIVADIQRRYRRVGV
jgi:hypothetical protein